ncbi:hypothetical protein MTO96_029897 [Rhipicephalus appendiculatus]
MLPPLTVPPEVMVLGPVALSTFGFIGALVPFTTEPLPLFPRDPVPASSPKPLPTLPIPEPGVPCWFELALVLLDDRAELPESPLFWRAFPPLFPDCLPALLPLFVLAVEVAVIWEGPVLLTTTF